MKTTIVSILMLISLVSFAQNDTIYLFKTHLELNGQEYNVIENELRTGKWIEFSIEDNTFISSLGSGDNVHFHYNIYTQYRPLQNGEYNGIEILSSENEVDSTADGQLVYSGSYLRIVNRIPSDKYYIVGKGNYKKDRKEGKWIYLYKNGKNKKEILYENGIPKKGFIIYRADETKMIELIKINDNEWAIIKYSESGIEIDRERRLVTEFEELY